MNRVGICFAEVVTPLGSDLDSTWKGLNAGCSAMQPVKDFDTSAYVNNLAAYVREVCSAPHLSRVDGLIDLFFELHGRGLPCKIDLLIAATTKAGIDLLPSSDWNKELPSQALLDYPAKTALQTMAEKFPEVVDTGCPVQTVSAACASGTLAVMAGARAIRSQRAECVLVIGVDVLSEFVFSGFSALKAMTGERCRPFDLNRSGLLLGEGLGAIVLCSEAFIKKNRIQPLGELKGWGSAADCCHLTAPHPQGAGLGRALQAALNTGRIDLNENDLAICAHGTGTVKNDAMELAAFKSLFKNDRQVSVFSVKGALGHSMGACGVLETVFSLACLEHQIIPPTCALLNPEDTPQGWLNSVSTSWKGKTVLNCNSGFGGINAAVALRRWV